MLKIGLLLDSDQIPQILCEFIKQFVSQPSIEIKQAIILGNSKKTDKIHKFKSKVILPPAFKKLPLFLRFETLVGKMAEYSKYFDLIDLDDSIDRLYYDQVDFNSTESFDFLLYFGISTIPESIIEIYRDKILLLLSDHDELLLQQFPGILEITQQNPEVRFKIAQFTSDGKNLKIIAQGSTANNLLPAQNHIKVLKKAFMFLYHTLGKMTNFQNQLFSGHLISTHTKQQQANTQPSLICKYLIKQMCFLTLIFFRHIVMKKRYRWEVAYTHSNNFIKGSTNQSITTLPVKQNTFYADPFVIHKDDKIYCLVEEYNYKFPKGVISAFDITHDPVYLGVVLEEPFHLSFPFLFKYNDEIYMCPESSAQREIRIYKSVDFPYRWELATILMNNISAVDTMIFSHNGLWWMLTNIDSTNTDDFSNELHIFYTDHPLSTTWQPHPMNPVINHAVHARNGGMLSLDGTLYRVSQNIEFFRYGTGTVINRIDQLDVHNYNETQLIETLPDQLAELLGTSKLHGHHHLFSDGLTTVFDYCRLIKPV